MSNFTFNYIFQNVINSSFKGNVKLSGVMWLLTAMEHQLLSSFAQWWC